jgi:cyclopropane fatty-acyl-phospholipid synthase-like methyltransferase
MDVPSPIDFHRIEEARAWADTANGRRPWRIDFFAAIVRELRGLAPTSPEVLELGSGPGFLAAVVVQEMPGVSYTLLDQSAAMHGLARARVPEATRVRFVTADFRQTGWAEAGGPYDAVVTLQAVHELRHRVHAVGLHREVRTILRPEGLYLVCDHILGPEGMSNSDLYMTTLEQGEALRAAGFLDVDVVLEQKGLVLHKARRAA